MEIEKLLNYTTLTYFDYLIVSSVYADITTPSNYWFALRYSLILWLPEFPYRYSLDL